MKEGTSMPTRLLRLTLLCVLLTLVLANASAQTNNWIGPYDTGWNNNASWSLNTVPGPGDDVGIYNYGGYYDYVILDTSPTINSLTLGGAYNGYYSYLVDNGVAQNLS